MSAPKHEFFGGSGWLQSSEVRRLSAETFKDLVDAMFSAPAPMRITRGEFHKLDKETRDQMKSGSYLVPCSFKESPSPRRKEHADKVQLVCIDLDEGGFVKGFAESPATVSEALSGLQFLCYSTANHTPAAPRLRIMVPVVPCAVTKYPFLVRHVANLLGLPEKWKGRTESNVFTQAMAKPVQFDCEDPLASILASRTSGEPLDWKTIPQEKETTGDDEFVYAYEGDRDDESGDNLAFLPIPDLKVEDLRDVITAIDAGCDRENWVRAGMALRHQFPDEDDAREAFFLYDEWSATGANYADIEDVKAQWRSFKPYAAGRDPVTIRSLFKQALDAGWKSDKLATRFQDNVEAWLAKCSDKDVLMSEGGKRIAMLPFKNEVVEEALMRALRARIKVVTGTGINLDSIKKLVHRLRSHKKREEDDGNTPSWLRPWFYVGGIDIFYNSVTGEKLKPEAFNRCYGKELMPKDENDDQSQRGKPTVLPCDFALNVKDTPKVAGILYDPRKEDAVFEHKGRTWVNSYRPSSVPRESAGKSKYVGEVLVHHLATIISEPALRRLVLDWMAFNVQFPGIKIRWCIVIQSAEGSGKTILVEWMRAAMGSENVKSVSPAGMSSNFNDWICDAQVIALEEIWIQGPGRADNMNILTDAFTHDKVTINAKFCPVVDIDNIANLIAFTNHHNALFIDSTNRRYTFIESCIQTEDAALALQDSGHFERLVECFQKYPGAVRHFLKNHKISEDFNPNGRAPESVYNQQIVQASKNRQLVAIEEEIIGEDPRIAEDIIDLSVLNEKLNSLGRDPELKRDPALWLKKLGFVPWQGGQLQGVNGHRTAIWVHREKFEPFFGSAESVLTERTMEFNEKELA